MINLSEVTVVGADASVLSWPKTARLDSIGIVPNKMQIRTSGTGHWTPVDINTGQDSSGDGNPSNDPDQGGTLWVFEQINGKWYASGAERLRPSQLNGDKPVADPSQGGLSTLIGGGWLYDANRWGPMAGRNPSAGELVGFMVTSGSTRLDTKAVERERTGVVVCRWPDAAGRIPFEEVWREGAAVPDSGISNPGPVVTPAPQPVDDSWKAAVSLLSGAVNHLTDALAAETKAREQAELRIAELSEKATTLENTVKSVKVPTSGYVRVFGTRIPVTFE